MKSGETYAPPVQSHRADPKNKQRRSEKQSSLVSSSSPSRKRTASPTYGFWRSGAIEALIRSDSSSGDTEVHEEVSERDTCWGRHNYEDFIQRNPFLKDPSSLREAREEMDSPRFPPRHRGTRGFSTNNDVDDDDDDDENGELQPLELSQDSCETSFMLYGRFIYQNGQRKACVLPPSREAQRAS